MNTNKSWKTTVTGIIAALALFASTNTDVAALIGPLGVKIASFVSMAAVAFFGNSAKDKDKTGISQ